MSRTLFLWRAFLFPILAIAASLSLAQGRETLLLDAGWKFHLGSASDPQRDFGYGEQSGYSGSGNASGPASPYFDDAAWRTLDLPHDWSIELPMVQNGSSFLVNHGDYPVGRAFPNTSIGWYRRRLSIPTRDQGKRLTVTFDGVFRDAKVWLNGYYLGQHLSGYSGFTFDITDFVHFGAANELVVRVDASEHEGWFYEGSGIYRHVWLTKTPELHLAENGLQAIATVQGENGEVKLFATVKNASTVAQAMFRLSGTVVGPDNRSFRTPDVPPVSLLPGQTATFALPVLQVPQARLWSVETPQLYAATVAIQPVAVAGASAVDADSVTTKFGFRTLRYDKDSGFYLNGKRVEIQGTCNHQDHAGVGAAVPDAVWYYRVRRLKAMGSNAIRTSHNAPAPALLQACDELGMLVMDENRVFLSSPEALEDLTYLVKRDRNHPSVIMWSIGNEEGAATNPTGAKIALTMKRAIHQHDSTRPVTIADNHGNAWIGANSVMDLRGWNYYTQGNPDEYHRAHPSQPVFGSEEASTLATRGIYANDPDHGYMGSYDTNKPGWGSTAEEWWSYYMARPWLAGAFVWTGFDYRGEPTPYAWPCISSHFGILDTCGFAKDAFYYYQSQWTTGPMVHILPDWNWAGSEGQPISVWIYSNAPQVELFLNGKSLGKQIMPKYGHAEYKVPYAAGALEAHGLDLNGATVSTDIVKTAGAVAKLLVAPDLPDAKADGEDVAIFNLTAFDSADARVPAADNDVTFRIEGDATILGVGNGDPSSHEPDTFVAEPINRSVSDLGLITLPAGTSERAWQPELGQGVAVKVQGRPAQVAAGQTGLLVGRFTAPEGQSFERVELGLVSGDATVYLNGTQLAHSAGDAPRPFSIAIPAGLVKPGENVLSIFVKAGANGGGVGRALTVIGASQPPVFHRRLFNGHAQVLVKLGTHPGRITLTATSQGLPTATATVNVNPATPRPAAPLS
jgi:beta-galactosidase